MSDSDDPSFVKPRLERKKEKRKKKKKSTNPRQLTVDDVELSPAAEETARKRFRRLQTTTEEAESSDDSVVLQERLSTISSTSIKRERVSPLPDHPPPPEKSPATAAAKPAIAAPAPAKTAPVKPAPAKTAPARATSGQLVQQASHLATEILNFCLEEKNKIGKVQTTSIMERVTDLTRLVSTLALENNYLSGEIAAYKSIAPRAQPSHAPTRQPAAHPTPAAATPQSFSYASVAGRNSSAPRRAAANSPLAAFPPLAATGTPSPRPLFPPTATPSLRPLLAPNGVLPPPPKQRLASQVIAAAQSAPTKHQIVITPAEPVQGECGDLKRRVFSHVDLRKAHAGISSIRATRDGSLVVETPHAKDLKLFTENQALRKAGFSVAPPKSELPRIVVYDIPKELEAAEISEHIRAQNIQSSPATDKATLRPLFKVGRKDKEGNDWVVEVANCIRETLVPKGRIFVSYSNCRVADYLVATRCYKCQKYGHVDKYCKSSELVCAFCAKTGHSNKECPNRETTPTCSNCRARNLPHSHSAGNRNCPSRSSALLLKASRINYNG